MKKLISILLLTALVASGCSPSPTAVSVNGSKVDASELAFYMFYNSTKSDDMSDETARELALKQIATSEVVRQMCREYSLKLTGEQKDKLLSDKKALVEQLGGSAMYLEYLNKNMLTDRGYDKFAQNAVYYDMLYQYITEEADQARYSDQEMRRFFGDNYVLVKYIRLSLLDDQGVQLPVAQAADVRQQAERIHAQLRQGAPFDAAMDEYNDDETMSASPSGLIVNLQQVSPGSFLLTATKLKSGEMSDIVDSRDAIYIIKRLELSAGYYDTHRESIIAAAKQSEFNAALDARVQAADVKTSKVVQEMTLKNLREYIK